MGFEKQSRYWAAVDWRIWLLFFGNVIFTLLAISLAFWAQSIGALPLPSWIAALEQKSTKRIPYQGRLTDAHGIPLTGSYNMEFRLYDVPMGGTPLWEEMWTSDNSVEVSDGLLNVMLGTINNNLASAIEGYDELYLGVTVGNDIELSPRVPLGSVPFSMQALTGPDGSVTTEKIADGAVTSQKLAPGTSGAFGGRPGSYPYLLHLRHFGLNVGNFCWGYVPGDPINSSSDCDAYPGLEDFTAGVTLYASSGNGYASSANNFPTVNNTPRWGYAYSFFLNNPDTGRSITLPVSSCNDVAVYVTTGTVAPNQLGNNVSLEYHRFPGNGSNPDLQGCPCDSLNPTLNVPAGSWRLTMLTRGASCTSYFGIGNKTGNWIQDANLEIDWPNMRAYLGEQ